jgi:hypothetical protein
VLDFSISHYNNAERATSRDGGDYDNGQNDQEDDDLDEYIDWGLADDAAGGDRIAGGTPAIPTRAATSRPLDTCHASRSPLTHILLVPFTAENAAEWSWIRPETNAAPDERDPNAQDAGSQPRDMEGLRG